MQVLAQPGNYGNSTTYTILRATGGVSGTYSGVTSNFAFLTPTLSYDANDVFLTLSLQPDRLHAQLPGATDAQQALSAPAPSTRASPRPAATSPPCWG